VIAFGYLIILFLLVGLTILCFVWGFWEYKKPKDSGPLFIDLDRTIDERSARVYKIGETRAPELYAHSGKTLSGDKLDKTTEWNHIVDEISRDRFETRARTWMQEAETIRVRGDVRIPRGEVIQYNLIVEGDLTSEADVTFLGGLHVKGSAIIGARNFLGKSIVCQRELIVLEDVIIRNCIDCKGPVFVKRGARVGMGVEGGGIASASNICVEKAEGPLKVHSVEGVRVVESLKEVVSEDLKSNVEVETI
jgi:hypothetical protein